jgi:hypothetical protein
VRRARVTVVLLGAVLTASAVSSCSWRERVCGADEYPVRTTTTTDDGLACTPDDEEPPDGYERFPAGEVPEYVDDLYP